MAADNVRNLCYKNESKFRIIRNVTPILFLFFLDGFGIGSQLVIYRISLNRSSTYAFPVSVAEVEPNVVILIPKHFFIHSLACLISEAERSQCPFPLPLPFVFEKNRHTCCRRRFRWRADRLQRQFVQKRRDTVEDSCERAFSAP